MYLIKGYSEQCKKFITGLIDDCFKSDLETNYLKIYQTLRIISPQIYKARWSRKLGQSTQKKEISKGEEEEEESIASSDEKNFDKIPELMSPNKKSNIYNYSPYSNEGFIKLDLNEKKFEIASVNSKRRISLPINSHFKTMINIKAPSSMMDSILSSKEEKQSENYWEHKQKLNILKTDKIPLSNNENVPNYNKQQSSNGSSENIKSIKSFFWRKIY